MTLRPKARGWRRATSLLLLCCVLAGCLDGYESEAEQIKVTASDSGDVRVLTIEGSIETLPIWSVPASRQRVVGGNEGPLLGAIGEALFLPDGSLVVEDNQSGMLWQFEAPGYGSSSVVGRQGTGPGEFRNITELSLGPGDRIVAFDRSLQRLTYLDAGERSAQTVALGPAPTGESIVLNAWAMLEPTQLLFEGYGPARYETTSLPRRVYRDVVLGVLDTDADSVIRSLTFPGGYLVESESGESRIPFAHDRVLSARGQAIVYGSGRQYELFVNDQDLNLKTLIRWRDWTRPLSQDDILDARASMEAAMASFLEAQPEIATELLDARFAEEILPTNRPALGRIMVDGTGRIWVSDFVPSTSRWHEESAWHVLGPDGHPQAVVPLPPRSRLVAVGGERIAIVRRDDLDVERVVVGVIEGPGS